MFQRAEDLGVDCSPEDVLEFIDDAVRDLLARAGMAGPSVDMLELAQSHFRIPVEYVEPDRREGRQYGSPAKRRPNPRAIVLQYDLSEESRQALAGRAVARQLVPGLFARLGIVPGTENRSAERQLIGTILPRLILPTRLFAPEARRGGYDLFALKAVFAGAGYEMIAWRMLDVDDEASVVAVVDDGTVSARRCNRFAVSKSLTEAEARCVRRVTETKDPVRARCDDWTAWGWPVSGIPFRRIVLRAVPDGI